MRGEARSRRWGNVELFPVQLGSIPTGDIPQPLFQDSFGGARGHGGPVGRRHPSEFTKVFLKRTVELKVGLNIVAIYGKRKVLLREPKVVPLISFVESLFYHKEPWRFYLSRFRPIQLSFLKVFRFRSRISRFKPGQHCAQNRERANVFLLYFEQKFA